MIKEFQEGEVYRNSKLTQDVMVYAVGIDDPEEVVLAVGFIDRASEEMTTPGELTVKKADFGDWELLKL
jgi:hypothetical protein